MKFPPQHGAWAFLLVPSVITSFLGGGTWLSFIFAFTWLTAYPFTYFFGRALISRWRRGSWTDRGSRELHFALPWALVTAVGATVIAIARPWIFFSSVPVLLLWSVSVYLSWVGRERGITNDLVLVGLASIEPILMYQVAIDENSVGAVPHRIWMASLVSLLFFIGSILHVKALIRESKNPKWHIGSIVFHSLAILGLAFFVSSGWLFFPFALALGRTLFMKPGLRPGGIGIVEAVLATAMVVGTVYSQI